MENKDYINEIISYLKDDRPAHANASMRKYMEHLGYTKNEIGEGNIDIYELLNEKDNEITKLLQKLAEKEKAIQEVLNTRKMSKLLYYVGCFIGVIGIIIGLLTENNILYTIAGLSMFIVGITGLYEVWKNKW